MIKTKRVYGKSAKEDGTRVLVDKLRKWFGHDPSKWKDFKRRCTKELQGNRDLKKKLESWNQKLSEMRGRYLSV